jgi:hypothetical protein
LTNPQTEFSPSRLVQNALTKYEQYDYQGALKDLNKANQLKPNDAFTLTMARQCTRVLRSMIIKEHWMI